MNPQLLPAQFRDDQPAWALTTVRTDIAGHATDGRSHCLRLLWRARQESGVSVPTRESG